MVAQTSKRHLFAFLPLFHDKNSEYDQETPQTQTADKPMAPRGRTK